ncbi:MAG: NADH-quinone oxidoreductase subunit J [Parachlamydiaceae bacterium]|nr:NADH-quinone oxidoreductase subunit J [Parachlamydiaceae bacterium]
MALSAYLFQWALGLAMILSALGVLLARKPVHASLSFLLTLMTLALTYINLSASFIGVMQVLVYGGAILVTFIFVIILFQDAHYQIDKHPAHTSKFLLYIAAVAFIAALVAFAKILYDFPTVIPKKIPDFGNVEGLGRVLYLDFFFPFEAVIFLFLVAIVGAFFIGKKDL